MGLATGAALAQDAATTPPPAGEGMHRGHGPMSPDQQLEHMTKALNLTADQQTQINPLLEARRQQMMQMHADQSLSREDRMTKFKALDDDTHVKIAAVLDDKQKAKFEKMQERREEHMEHMDHGGGSTGSQAPQ
jgi:Spy/CpxP family protein refolding chaperone